jgi:hypothetical protein
MTTGVIAHETDCGELIRVCYFRGTSENSGVTERSLPEINCERFAPEKQPISLLARLWNATNLLASSSRTEEVKETLYLVRHSCHDLPRHFGSANMPSDPRLHTHWSWHYFDTTLWPTRRIRYTSDCVLYTASAICSSLQPALGENVLGRITFPQVVKPARCVR